MGTLLQEICTPMFAAKSETTKKSKKNGYDGKTYRLVTYPHPKSEDQTTESRHFGDSEAAMERLVMTIPNHVQGVAPHSQAVDQVMVAAVNSKRMVTFMIGKETTEPPAFRALAHSFDRYVVFGYLSTTDPSILERFQIKSVPALVTMFAQPDPEEKEKKQEYIDKKSTADDTPKNVQFGMAAYSIEAYGDIQYGNAGAWLQQVIGQVKPEGRPLLEGEEDNFGSSSSSSSSSSTTSKEDTGPLKEMTKNNFDLLCPMKNRLCTILLVDGSQKEQTKEVIASVEIAKQKESGMLSWSWMDGICHSKLTTLLLGESIDLASTLPTAVVISRSKGRRVMLVGNPKDSADVVNFVRAVKRGQRKTIGMTKKETDLFVHGTPSENFSKNECISVHQKLKKEAEEAAAADSDDGMDMDDMMAEIREEEEREKKERDEKAEEEKIKVVEEKKRKRKKKQI